MEETFHTPEEVAERLGISVATLAKWRFKRVGPAYAKFGARVRYGSTDVGSWLEQSRRETEAHQTRDGSIK